ncbi:MAG: nucleoside-diphosphate sugar epimerase/dehydratase [Eubacteriales bacterium]|nr:nucleoside-diphosphate sugar epimerase/dehydratase [Eubacteriales bacterium]
MKTLIKDSQYRARAFLLLVADVAAVIIASYMGLLIRFEFDFASIGSQYINGMNRYMPINIICTVIIFYAMRMYTSLWKYASVREMSNVAAGVLLSGVLQIIVMSVAWDVSMPRSYFVIYTLFLGLSEFCIRFGYRLFRFVRNEYKSRDSSIANVMVIGAGDAGAAIIKEIRLSKYVNQKVCCVIDDNPAKYKHFIEGCQIVGDRNTIKKNVEKFGIQKIIIAIPTATRKITRELVEICQETDCEIRILPGTYQLINGEVSASQLREVQIEDLLGRDQINVNNEEVFRLIKGRTIMVTGGGGSIGSELCRQIAANEPGMLIVFDIYENNAYEIQQELKRKYPSLNMLTLIGSVRNTNRINSVMMKYRPDVVFHAAAHKHVPLMEDSPNEAIKNNVMGTYKTARAAVRADVKKFVLISTDKAVNPTNVMGATKRICEMIVQMMDRENGRTDFVAVRFGNVLGSNGSVIPLFKKQIAEGGPVTVTDKNIIRYFMTIPEAVSLVLQAAHYAKGGEIFVLDMGNPVRIDDMARNLIRLSGFKPDVDIKIEYTGLRPGEKLYEELLMDEEGLSNTENKLIYIGHPIDMDDKWFRNKLKELDEATRKETHRTRELIAEIVPTYHYNGQEENNLGPRVVNGK